MTAPALPGDIITWPIENETVFLQSGSFLAAPATVDVDSKWGGSKTFFSSEGLFTLKCVGWSEQIAYEVHKAGNWKSTLLGGEGLVVHLTEPGRIYIQTRSPQNLIDWIIPKLPADRS